MVVINNSALNNQQLFCDLATGKQKHLEELSKNKLIQNKLHNMTFSAHTIQGRRNHMEDYFDIAYQQKSCDHEHVYTDIKSHIDYFFFGIFDGHGGKSAAKYTRDNLLSCITKQPGFWTDNDQQIMDAIKRGFLEIQAKMLELLPEWPGHSNLMEGLPSTAGTTASILFIKNQKYYTGHVGDSRIVLARENPETKFWISKDLTTDHKPESPEEKTRIEAAGGEVRNKLGVHRVVWKKPIIDDQYFEHNDIERISKFPIPDDAVSKYIPIPFLAIARSLGDFWSIDPYTKNYVVSPEPDVNCIPIHENDKGIVLASDGLWNVMYSELAIRIVQQMDSVINGYETECYQDIDNFYSNIWSGNYAKNLIDIAYQIWEWKSLKSDNITAIVIKFDEIFKFTKEKPCVEDICKECICTYSPFIPISEKTIDSESKHIDKDSLSYFEAVKPGIMPKLKGQTEYNDLESKFYSLSRPSARLPPTLTKLDAPKNYQRLSEISFRKLILYFNSKDRSILRFGDEKDYAKDSFYTRTVLIARATDDPEDLVKKPARLNSNKKFVRDSSCQATQPLQDFGQSWHCLMRFKRPIYLDVNNSSNTNNNKSEDSDSSSKSRKTKNIQQTDVDLDLDAKPKASMMSKINKVKQQVSSKDSLKEQVDNNCKRKKNPIMRVLSKRRKAAYSLEKIKRTCISPSSSASTFKRQGIASRTRASFNFAAKRREKRSVEPVVATKRFCPNTRSSLYSSEN